MTKTKITSLLLAILLVITAFPTMAEEAVMNPKAVRQVYLHAQGENPTETVNNSTVYLDEDTDIYFAVNDPNMGDFVDGVHKEPQYDLNGYTLRVCYDPDFFILPDTEAPFTYELEKFEDFTTTDKGDEDIGEDTGINVPQKRGYFIYQHGAGEYAVGTDTYATAFITVFYSGGYVPQKEDGQLWYNLACLSLTPRKAGSTDVFIDIDSGDENYALELFAKNDKSDELSDQTFEVNAVNGGFHHITIKDRAKPVPPIAQPGAGSYVEAVTVRLTQESNLPIYYTLDGSIPTTSSPVYDPEKPFVFTEETEIKTFAYRESDGKSSNVVSYLYKILPDRPYLFDEEGALLPDRYSEATVYDVVVSNKSTGGPISDGSEVYYTFSNAEVPENVDSIMADGDPEAGWVQVSKQNPMISVTQNRTVRMFTDKTGIHSDATTYFLAIRPAKPVADHPSDTYNEKIDVTLSCETEDAVIYYTTDGTDPQTSTSRRAYTGVPITLSQDTTLRAVSCVGTEWSEKSTYYYLFDYYDDYGVNAFYPSGVYEGSVNVTLTPNNPNYTVLYHTGDGKWKEFSDVLTLDENTDISAKAVECDSDGKILSEGEPYTFIYRIKPLPPAFAPESTQFTNADRITVFTPESTEENTERFSLYYTLDGTNPITSDTRILADEESDSALLNITKYTVVSAVVQKDGETYSSVVTHSYDIVTVKPVKPMTTLLPGYYTVEIGGEPYKTQFMPVPNQTQIYYTVEYDGGLCPDPVPGTSETHPYTPGDYIDIKGNTVIKAIAVNPFGVKSDIGIFNYKVTPQAPVAAPSATVSGTKLPIVPVDAVEGSTVKYTVGTFINSFPNTGDTRFYIDTATGGAFRDEACTQPLGNPGTADNKDRVTLQISAELDGVESDENRYVYAKTDDEDVLAPPYADKLTGMYLEKKIDNKNNLLRVRLYSLNTGGEIQYRLNNEGGWITYTDPNGLLLKEDTVLQLRHAKNGNYSTAVSYVYNFVPLAPIIDLPSGTYLVSEKKTTTLSLDTRAPGNKQYSIWYRANGDKKDFRYTGQERAITHTMSFKAYVRNEETGRISANTIHYYIIESGDAASGSVYITYPYNTDRISAHVLDKGDYAEGIKLHSHNQAADIHYYYVYTRKSDGQTVQTNEEVYHMSRPIIPNKRMDDITIYAWLEDEYGKIPGSDSVFPIDFIHLNIPTTSLEGSGKVEFTNGTKYTLIHEYEDDPNIILYYTLDGSDPSDSSNKNRIAYTGETLRVRKNTTVKAVYFSACGKCKDIGEISECHSGVYGEVGTYQYSIIQSGGGSSSGGGGGAVDNTRKYTKDIFGNEHPTHIGYINGYPDGGVRPEGDITREEIAAILYRVTNHEYEAPFVETGAVFPDVEFGRWSVHNIEYLADKGVIIGYPDGEYKPTRNLTRAEFAALIFRFAKLEHTETENPFADLEKAHWAYADVLALVESGLVEGYEDGTFRPEDNISRAEVMTVINKLLGRKPLEEYVKSLDFNPYNDLFEDKWYYVTVLEATITHNYWLDDHSGYEYLWEDWK